MCGLVAPSPGARGDAPMPMHTPALGAVARKMRIRRYLELGIYTAWSTTTIVAFFTRVGL